MRSKLIILIFLFYSIIQANLFAQVGFNSGDPDGGALTDSRFQDFFTNIRHDVRKYNPSQIGKKIKGSPYLNKSFKLGSVKHKEDSLPNKLYLRYNSYNDEIEIGTHPDQKISEKAILKRNNIVCVIDNEVFLYTPFLNKENKTKLGYLTPLLTNKKIGFYIRRKTRFLEETIPRTSLERGFPPRFIHEKEYFLSINNNTPRYLGNTIKNASKNLPETLKKEAKKNNINLKKIKEEEKLLNILTHLDGKIK